jgi:tetratricopeptide (TPR) repeat protein
VNRPSGELSEEHRMLLRFLARVHQENGGKKLDAVAAEMHLRSRSRVSYLMRGQNRTLPANEAQLVALVRALGGGTDDVDRGLALYRKARRSRVASDAAGRVLNRETHSITAPFVGRRPELDRVRDLVSDLAVGRGAVVLVEGEPGIGKSFLARAAATAAEAAGCRVLRAACDELSMAIPLLPMLDVLADDEPVSGGHPFAVGNRVDLVAAATERVIARINGICAESPVLLVVDDLQWADRETVVTLARMVRLASQRPLLIFGLARPVPRRDDLDALRRVVGRTGTVALRPLSDDEVAEFVRAVVGAVPGPRLLRLAADASGNPLYLIELVDALHRAGALAVDGGTADIADDWTPNSLAGAIAHRLDFLSSGTSDVIRSAALLGSDFALSELAVVSGRRPIDLLPAIEEATTAGVLRDQGETLAFRHPLIRAILYGRTPATVRAAWHRDAARSLADDGAPVEKVARQLLPALEEQGRRADGWLVHWLAASGQQLTGRAPDAAVRLLRWALATTTPGTAAYPVLVCRLADALYRVGGTDEAATLASAAIAHVTDPDLLVDLLWTWLACDGKRGHPGESRAALEHALSSPGIQPRHRARLLVMAARMQRGLGRLDDAARGAVLALEAAVSAGDRWATAWATGLQSIIEGMRGHEDELLALSARAVAIAEDDPTLADLRLMLLVNRAAALGELDRHDEAVAVAEQASRLANEAHNVIRLVQSRSVLGELLYNVGRWDDALAEVDTEPGVKDPYAACCDFGVAACIRLHRGDPAASQNLVDAMRYSARRGERMIWQLVLAQSLEQERAGAADKAFALLRDGLAKVEMEVADLNLLADAVRLATTAGDEAFAATVVRRAQQIAQESTVPHRIAVVLHCDGLHNRSPSELLAAGERYAAAGRPLPRAQALEAAGIHLAEHGRRASARVHLAEAFSIYGRLAADYDVHRLRDVFQRHGLRLPRVGPG